MKQLYHNKSFNEQTLTEWSCVIEGDTNSLIQQSLDIAKETAVYAMSRELFSISDDTNRAIGSPVMIQWTVEIWARSAVSRIRAILDNSYGPKGDTGVCSLSWLLNDINSVRHSMSRRVYLDLCMGNFISKRISVLSEKAIVEDMNLLFDCLSGVSDPLDRKDDDVVSEQQFQLLTTFTNNWATRVGELATKLVAHAATDISLQTLTSESANTTYLEMYQMQMHIAKLVMYLAWLFFGSQHSPTGIYLGSLERDLFSSYAGVDYSNRVEQAWHTHFSSVFNWRNDSVLRLFSEEPCDTQGYSE